MPLRHHVEGGAARPAENLDPAGQDVVELQRGEVGLDPHAAVTVAAADLAGQLDRDRAGDCRTEIEPEAGAACVIERRLQLDVGVALRGLAIIECARLAVDLDVALDLITLIVGDHLQIIRLELLVHDQLVGGKAIEVDGRSIGGILFR